MTPKPKRLSTLFIDWASILGAGSALTIASAFVLQMSDTSVGKLAGIALFFAVPSLVCGLVGLGLRLTGR